MDMSPCLTGIKVMVIETFTKLERRMVEYSENLNKGTRNKKIAMKITKLKNTVMTMKRTLQEFSTRLQGMGRLSMHLKTAQCVSGSQSSTDKIRKVKAP